MDYSSAYAVIVSSITGLGLSTIAILTAIVAVATGLLVFRWGWNKTLQVSGEGIPYTLRNTRNAPGSAGYNSRRGTGASYGNVARMESEGSSGKKINMLG